LKEAKRFILNPNAAKSNVNLAEIVAKISEPERANRARRSRSITQNPLDKAKCRKAPNQNAAGTKANAAGARASAVAHEHPATGSPANFVGNSVQPPPWNVLRKLSGSFYNIYPVEM
jgi:hypothetical protein